MRHEFRLNRDETSPEKIREVRTFFIQIRISKLFTFFNLWCHLKLIKTGKEVDRLLRTSVLQTVQLKEKDHTYRNEFFGICFYVGEKYMLFWRKIK